MHDWLTDSVVVAALLTAVVALQNSERKINIEYVTGERAKWRDKIRKKALAVHRAAIAKDFERLTELKLEFTLLLNPNDDEDIEILRRIENLHSGWEPVELEIFAKQIAYLLKHDWERAKSEAEPFWRRTKPPARHVLTQQELENLQRQVLEDIRRRASESH